MPAKTTCNEEAVQSCLMSHVSSFTVHLRNSTTHFKPLVGKRAMHT